MPAVRRGLNRGPGRPFCLRMAPPGRGTSAGAAALRPALATAVLALLVGGAGDAGPAKEIVQPAERSAAPAPPALLAAQPPPAATAVAEPPSMTETSEGTAQGAPREADHGLPSPTAEHATGPQ